MTLKSVSAVEVGQSYMNLHHRLHRLVDQAMGEAGLTLSRAKVLMRLSECGPMNQATLAGLLGLAPRSVTETVDALERAGLVRRTECDNDRRARIVELTPEGHEAHDAAVIVRHKAMDETFGSLSASERATLAELLATVSNTVPSGENSCGN